MHLKFLGDAPPKTSSARSICSLLLFCHTKKAEPRGHFLFNIRKNLKLSRRQPFATRCCDLIHVFVREALPILCLLFCMCCYCGLRYSLLKLSYTGKLPSTLGRVEGKYFVWPSSLPSFFITQTVTYADFMPGSLQRAGCGWVRGDGGITVGSGTMTPQGCFAHCLLHTKAFL